MGLVVRFKMWTLRLHIKDSFKFFSCEPFKGIKAMKLATKVPEISKPSFQHRMRPRFLLEMKITYLGIKSSTRRVEKNILGYDFDVSVIL